MMIRKLLLPFALVLISLIDTSLGFAQEATNVAKTKQDSTKSLMLYFRVNRAVVDSGYMNNALAMKEINAVLTNETIISGLDSVAVVAASSPEGSAAYNIKLSKLRAQAVKSYLQYCYPFLKDFPVHTYSLGENWSGLKNLVEQDLKTPYRDEVLRVIEQNSDVRKREAKLRSIDGGRAYNYISKNMLRYLRSGAATIVFYRRVPTPQEIQEEKPVEKPVVIEMQKLEPSTVIAPMEEVKKPLFMVVKTNLLYDAVGVANIGVEMPINSKFSVNLPFMYSPYTIKRDYKLRILALQPELRYWLKESLRGHFFGLQGGVAWYNVAMDLDNRYQDNRPLYSVGLNYGYALPLSRHWGAEFTIGGGYANYSYDLYYNVHNGAKFSQKVIDYWGITNVGINIMYKFNLKK